MVITKNRPVKAANGTNAEAAFEEFSQANDSVEILLSFQKLKVAVGCEKVEYGKEIYTCLKSKLQSWKCKSLWEVLDARAKHKEYGNGKICEDIQVVVIGAGPIGLRTAIELALLGAKVIVVEKRTTFGRNNVLHLWPFLIQDFRSLGAKKFYGKFCAGSLDHISIRILQCTLMKTALIMGVQIYAGVTFEKLIEPTGDTGWRCSLDAPFHPASQVDFDMVVGADGKKNVLPDFPQIEMRGSLAIGITLNLVYNGTKEEAAIPEVSGLAYHFKPQFFDELYQRNGVRLENFVYYKNETHYFVMTAVKSSLLARGALLMDYPKPDDLLAPKNVNTEKLKEYALDAVHYGTDGQLNNPEFVQNDRGKPDIAVFDFTSLKKAEHAARIVERRGHRLLIALVGDSLIEPFWPTGSGCARGVLSALDTAWMLRSFAMDKPPLQILSERESVYKLLSATTVNNLRKKYNEYTINPFSRYADVNLKRVKEVYHLYDSDDPVNADFRVSSPSAVGVLLENTKRRMSISNRQPKGVKNRRKSSSDDLDEKKENTKRRISITKAQRNGLKSRQKSSTSDDLDESRDGKSKKSKKTVSHSGNINENENPDRQRKISKSGKTVKKHRSGQSSESADEDVQTKRKKKMGRGKSRESSKGSDNNLDTITETPRSEKKTGDKEENKDNSLIMKQRSTKRWRLFGGSKPKLKSVDQDEKTVKSNESSAKKGHNKKDDIEKKNEVGKLENKKEMKKSGIVENSENIRREPGSIRETFGVTTTRKFGNEVNSSPKRTSIRKPSEIKKDESLFHQRYSRSQSVIHTRTPEKTTQLKRPNSEIKRPNIEVKRINGDIKRNGSLFGSARRAKQEKTTQDVVPSEVSPVLKKAKPGGLDRKNSKQLTERKKTGSVSVFDDIKSLSPAAQRTAPVLLTLTPEKKDKRYSEGGVVTTAAGIAALVALTTPLAIEEKQPLKEFQMKRQKILSGQTNAAENKRRPRRDLSSALDNVDGSPKPIKRFFSFSSAKRNVKQKLEEDSQKSLTLPKRVFGRHSLKSDVGSSFKDTPSALDSAMGILIKEYKFIELQNTLKLMLNIFRSISKDPEGEIPRRIFMDGEVFRPLISDIKEAKLFMVVSGWIEVGSFILFPKSKTVHEPIRVLMQNYRTLMEKQNLDISCPQFSSTSVGTKQRRESDDMFRLHEIRRTSSGIQSLYRDLGEFGEPGARDDGRDTGSHSSDSGMGFSETASEKNIAAVILEKTSEDNESNSTEKVGPSEEYRASTGDKVFSNQHPSVTMDPRMYLEDSGETQRPFLDPSHYTKDKSNESLSVAGENRGLGKGQRNWEVLGENVPTSRSPEGIHYSPVTQTEEMVDETETNYGTHSFQEPKKHRWEILEKSLPIPHSPEGIRYSPMTQGQQHEETTQDTFKDSSFQEAVGLSNMLDTMLESMEEPIPYQVPHVSITDPIYPEVFTDSLGDHGGKEIKKNELDDLFDTLDFVTEELQPPRVVCPEKTTNGTKKSRRHPKSTETSRRREQFARMKTQANASEERASPRPKRKTRNPEGALTRQAVAMDTNEKYPKQVQRREMPKRAAKAGKTDLRKQETVEESCHVRHEEVSAVESNTGSSGSEEPEPRLRRSRRIADSMERSRKTILTLESSCGIEESSTDLNEAFVNTGLGESQNEGKQETGNESRDSTKSNPKRRVRRKSSIVKSNKSRARVKRAGYKSRKDRSIDA